MVAPANNSITKMNESNSDRVNIKPEIWGDPSWSFLYSIALGYPNNPTDEEKQAGLDAIYSLRYLLPCTSCRTNFIKELKKYPPEKAMKDSNSFLQYINTLDNSVSVRLGKNPISLEDAITRLKNRSKNRVSTTSGADGNTIIVPPPPPKVCPSQYWHLVWIILLTAVVTAVCTWAVTKSVTTKKYKFLAPVRLGPTSQQAPSQATTQLAGGFSKLSGNTTMMPRRGRLPFNRYKR